ncbi:glycosyltransferase [Pigmentiphaga kullae]|uniref:Glycosyltransferase involved in cell wall biosynthesis n=1 Tax=Pigmentiphaga kullae TaxID=151784 RepID=A0A4Q7N6Q1_9BURK|nr:glycosyltransferase [Pigmentiphaga kullae]RZS77050.1 glycosyltransferase involved in cell wall biosynthesis [Pigmentiphaga kullae]
MLRASEAARIASRLNGPLISRYREEDGNRLAGSYFGLGCRPTRHSDCVLLVGARSGFEIVHLLASSQVATVCVVEPNRALKTELDECLENIETLGWRQRVRFYATLEEFLQGSPGNLAAARIAAENFDWAGLRQLLQQCAVGHVCGDFDPLDADPLEVYRFCRARAESFYWRVKGLPDPMAASGPAAAFEVSVVVPAYKVLPWIDRCMQTLVDQTLRSLEIIAVDDGSPDATGERLDEWAAKYPERVKVVHKPNGGCASARNAGARVAQGEYVAFVDGDDWVGTEMFEALYRSAVLNAADIAQCGYIEAFEDSGREVHDSTAWGAQSASGNCGLVADPRSYLVVRPTIWRRIYRQEFLRGNAIEFPEHIPRFDDLPFQFEALARVKRMSVIPECFYYYRQEREGQDIAVRDDRLFVHFPIFDWLDEKVGVWADAGLERQLLQCKINTHMWALGRIDRKFASRYFRESVKDILSHGAHFRWGGVARFLKRVVPSVVKSALRPAAGGRA